MPSKVHLLVIDPQNDFCLPGGEGALYVDGAEHDMERLSRMVVRLGSKLHIHVTMDSHHPVDCAHPIFWRGSDGAQPGIYTEITGADMDSGKWRPFKPSLFRRMRDYVDALETTKRYPLTIWPPHCLIGHPGHCIVKPLRDALRQWEEENFRTLNVVTKGSNPFTEHYSAVKAEVPDNGDYDTPADPSTQLNTDLIGVLEDADIILLAGQAGSHCLANTTLDIAASFQDKSATRKMVLLEDATSPVNDPDGQGKIKQEKFIHTMVNDHGMQLSTTDKFLAA